jgi:hypothetical protein
MLLRPPAVPAHSMRGSGSIDAHGINLTWK